MKIVVSNYDLGGLHLLYSTFEPLTRVHQDGTNILVVYGRAGERGEMVFSIPQEPEKIFCSGTISSEYKHETSEFLVYAVIGEAPSFLKLSWPGATSAWTLVFLEEELAGRVWRVRSDAAEELLIGPYFVPHQASHSPSRQTISFPIWIHTPTHVYLFPGHDVAVKVDGHAQALETIAELDLWHFTIEPQEPPGLPRLGPWRFNADCPEIEPGYDDGSWVTIPQGASLIPDLYGFHYGFVWYRGTYKPSPGRRPQALMLDGRHCYSAYWNGMFLGSHDTYSSSFMAPGAAGSPDLFPDPAVFRIPAETVMDTNTIAVIVESLGHNKDFALYPDVYNPRGIISCKVLGDPSAEIRWKIQGRGEDKGLGHFNSSGLHGELAGYYLPGHDDGGWLPVDLPHTWEDVADVPEGFVGTGWYRNTFWLDLPEGYEFPLCLHVRRASSKALIWLNGWLIGRYWERMGPQHRFYLPEGILNPHGENTLAVCLWRKGDEQGDPDPGVLDIAGLEPYPFDHRVSGAPPLGQADEPPPFSTTRYEVSVSTEAGGGSGIETIESGQGCGACRTAGRETNPAFDGIIAISLAGFIWFLKISLRKRPHTTPAQGLARRKDVRNA